MAFKKPQITGSVPETPDLLLRELPRRKIPDVMPHQAEIMKAYAATATQRSDVAMQLPTGSGKTLVGLLVAEWRRRKFKERIVYLCPTKQLVHQVAEQAHEKYGISVETFVGRQRRYSPASKANYSQAEKVAITTYSGLFNTNTFFDNADVIFLDDSHASENYIASNWTLRVDRLDKTHKPLHQSLCNVLSGHLSSTSLTKLRGDWQDANDRGWVEMLPASIALKIREDLIHTLDAHTQDLDLRYPWSLLRDHLDACNVFLSGSEILIRPLLPPTFSHSAFANAKQRIYMSATLGEGGDLERLTGRKSIFRLPAPGGWDSQGVGRRFFIFPEMSLTDDQIKDLRLRFIDRAGRSVVLVPSLSKAKQVIEELNGTTSAQIFEVEDIERSKTDFSVSPHAVAVIANRYDGVDFSGDECRLLFIEGLPKATNAQERFLISRMGANALYQERIQTRVIQAIGRCTRSLEDFSAVVVTGEDLPDYLSDLKRRGFFHPELQAEINFGVFQSKDNDADDIFENLDIFLKNDKDWEAANQSIVDDRKSLTKSSLPAIGELQASVSHEVDYQTALWRGDFESALAHAEAVLGNLTKPQVRGYRALWHYLAGTAALIGNERSGDSLLAAKSDHHYEKAYQAAPDVSWLHGFAKTSSLVDRLTSPPSLIEQVERLGSNIAELGISHSRKFSEKEANILSGLAKPTTFEQAQTALGMLLGFVSHKVEAEGSPDPYWICGKTCIVFEDFVDTDENGALDVKKARQVASHPNWIRSNVQGLEGCEIISVLLTPARNIRSAAIPQVAEVYLWERSEFDAWVTRAFQEIRRLRTVFSEEGDLEWNAEASEALQAAGLDIQSLVTYLKARPAGQNLNPV